jgi:RND family efflux transporter MFP subunit
VIGQIEPRDYELRLDQAAAALAQARATLGLSLDPDPTTPAPTTSTTTPGPDPSPGPGGGPETPSNPKRPPAVSAPTLDLDTVSSVRQAQAVLDEASKNRDRVRNLAQSGIASPSDLDTVESAHSVATARKQLALEDARTRLATLAQRRAEYEIARKQLADSTLTAPFSGAIQARIATAGEYIAAGAPVVRLVQTDPLRLRLEVPEREASLVHTSQAVRLSVEGLPGLYHGQLARLSPALSEQNRMLLVEADVPNPGDLRPGLFARAQIVVNPGEPALCVPTNALITFAGIEKVILVRDGKALEKNVTTGRRHSNVVEILSGLTNGTLVVLDPGPLRTGQPVAPEPIASR